MFRKQLLLWLIPCLCFSDPCERVYKHLQLGDTKYASRLAFQMLSEDDSSHQNWRVYLNSLSRDLQVKEALKVFTQYGMRFPEFKNDPEIIEDIAWSVIRKGNNSPSPLVRLYASIASVLSQDSQGVLLIRERLEDRNALIRKVAATLCGFLPDHTIHEQMYTLVQKETNPEVKGALIKGLAKAKYDALLPYLLNQIAKDQSTPEELSLHIEAAIMLTDTINDNQIKMLSKSDRAGLRALSCQLARHFERRESLPFITPLIHDYHPSVRASAIHAVGLLSPQSIEKLNDRVPSVAIMAAWATTLHDASQGEKLFSKWIDHNDPEIRIEAAAVLSQSGPRGAAIMSSLMHKSDDPFVKMTLAKGLIGEREDLFSASLAIQNGLLQVKGRLTTRGYEVGEAIIPCEFSNDPADLNMPEVANQMTRLKLINLLTAVDSEGGDLALREFLQQRSNAVTSLTLTTLLSEGEELSIDSIQEYLNHEKLEVRLQAALLIGTWLKDEEAISLLHTHLPTAKRDLKLQIIEGLGRVADKRSIPYLVEVLKEPLPTQQIITASSILQCLNR
ncbi:MAG: HEAT repeat domain-containing protein [Waddliaceae bacterium]